MRGLAASWPTTAREVGDEAAEEPEGPEAGEDMAAYLETLSPAKRRLAKLLLKLDDPEAILGYAKTFTASEDSLEPEGEGAVSSEDLLCHPENDPEEEAEAKARRLAEVRALNEEAGDEAETIWSTCALCEAEEDEEDWSLCRFCEQCPSCGHAPDCRSLPQTPGKPWYLS